LTKARAAFVADPLSRCSGACVPTSHPCFPRWSFSPAAASASPRGCARPSPPLQRRLPGRVTCLFHPLHPAQQGPTLLPLPFVLHLPLQPCRPFLPPPLPFPSLVRGTRASTKLAAVPPPPQTLNAFLLSNTNGLSFFGFPPSKAPLLARGQFKCFVGRLRVSWKCTKLGWFLQERAKVPLHPLLFLWLAVTTVRTFLTLRVRLLSARVSLPNLLLVLAATANLRARQRALACNRALLFGTAVASTVHSALRCLRGSGTTPTTSPTLVTFLACFLGAAVGGCLLFQTFLNLLTCTAPSPFQSPPFPPAVTTKRLLTWVLRFAAGFSSFVSPVLSVARPREVFEAKKALSLFLGSGTLLPWVSKKLTLPAVLLVLFLSLTLAPNRQRVARALTAHVALTTSCAAGAAVPHPCRAVYLRCLQAAS